MSSATTANPWDYFPLVMCINVKERAERFEEAKAELKRAGLKQVVFFRAERQPDRDKAIIDSHMACLKYAVSQGVSHVLVFEDDMLFQGDIQANMARVVEFHRQRPDCNIFYLGAFIFRKSEQVTPHILRGGMVTAHGYVMRTGFAKEVLARRPNCSGMSVDLFYSVLVGNNAFVHVDPLACIQRPSESDGTWDTRSLNKSGWLGNAMIYTSLDFRGRFRFDRFSFLERVRIQNGITFFKVFRAFLARKLAKAEARAKKAAVPVPAEAAPTGEYTVENL